MLVGKSILLIEDNADDELLTIRALKKNNIVDNIAVARDGAEAIDYLLGPNAYINNGSNPLPTLIILDLQLPKINGLEVLKKIREDSKLKHIPVVILTSSKEEQDVCAGYDFGANSFIRKPVDFLKFVEVAAHIGLYWLVFNEPHVIK